VAYEIIILAGLACLLTAAITVLLIRIFGASGSVTLGAGLALPILAGLWGLYDVFIADLEAEDLPPGLLLEAGLMMVFAMTPFTLLTSMLTVSIYNRRR